LYDLKVVPESTTFFYKFFDRWLQSYFMKTFIFQNAASAIIYTHYIFF